MVCSTILLVKTVVVMNSTCADGLQESCSCTVGCHGKFSYGSYYYNPEMPSILDILKIGSAVVHGFSRRGL